LHATYALSRGAALFSVRIDRVNAQELRLFEPDRAGLCESEADSLLSIIESFNFLIIYLILFIEVEVLSSEDV